MAIQDDGNARNAGDDGKARDNVKGQEDGVARDDSPRRHECDDIEYEYFEMDPEISTQYYDDYGPLGFERPGTPTRFHDLGGKILDPETSTEFDDPHTPLCWPDAARPADETPSQSQLTSSIDEHGAAAVTTAQADVEQPPKAPPNASPGDGESAAASPRTDASAFRPCAPPSLPSPPTTDDTSAEVHRPSYGPRLPLVRQDPQRAADATWALRHGASGQTATADRPGLACWTGYWGGAGRQPHTKRRFHAGLAF